jgi:hypothetical protein
MRAKTFKMTKKLLLLGTVVGALGFLSPAYAEIWNFNTPSGNLGPTHNYAGSAGTVITATAFGPNSPSLFGKILGGDEDGVGLTNDPSIENEITPGSFIQLSLANINFALNSVNMSFQADSATIGDTWQVFGSNTAGGLGGTLLGSCVATVVANPCEALTTINGAGNFAFLDVTAAAGNVLLSEVNTTAVPGPIVGAGLPGLVAACGGLLALARRRRRQVA